MEIVVSALDGTSPATQPLEMVERKGLGHPDTICDALAEEVSRALSRAYLERFGFVLHHNVDKVLLRGGAARPAFGAGVVLEPIEIYLAGRATGSYRGVELPIDAIAVEAARAWLAGHMHALDVERHVRIHCLIRPGSQELVELFERALRGSPRLANDSSLGVGFAPATPLERAVLEVERGLQDRSSPAFGEDVKVLGVRSGERIELTVACALIGRWLADLEAYLAAKRTLAERAAALAGDLAQPVAIRVNAADDPAAGSVYLSVTGTSAEAGDDGQTGRGNRVNGLITPARPMTIESFAGKNPITHVGKLYNCSAALIAEEVVARLPGVAEAEVLLVSHIGDPIERPAAVHLRLRPREGRALAELAAPAREIARAQLAGLGRLWERLIERNLATEEIAPPRASCR